MFEAHMGDTPTEDSKPSAKPTRTRKKNQQDTSTFYIDEPTELDVKMGRGGGTNQWAGNAHYRQVIEENKRQYMNAAKDDKTVIAQSVIDQINEEGGRFIRSDPASGRWFVVDNKEARKKASQALREENTPESRALKRKKYPKKKKNKRSY